MREWSRWRSRKASRCPTARSWSRWLPETGLPQTGRPMPLHVEKVSHRYGTVEALQGIELDIADGETVALIGPSGCGKSTLLGILGGLLEPSEGRVTLSGPPPADSLNPFTYVFQDFALLPWRSVADNVALALEHRALGAAERR